MPNPATVSAHNLWRRIRTPYGSFLAYTSVTVILMACVGDQVIYGAFCVLLLFAWCFYAICYMDLQHRKRQIESLQWTLRQLFVVIGCLAVIIGAIVNHWPLRWRFAISLAKMEQLADQMEGGLELEGPRAVGLFLVEKAELKRGVPCFWTDANSAGPVGFVRCTPEQAHNFNLWSTERMNDRWQLIVED